jgi:ATP-dependent Clp protease ATP-binding subunit ClpC
MFERFTDRARRVVVLSQEEARRLRHNYIGTEHVVLGLLGVPEGLAARALQSLGMSLEATRDQVVERVGPGGDALSGHIPFTPRAKKALEFALREALELGHNYIGTEHLLLGITREGAGTGAQVLAAQAGDLRAVRTAVLDLIPPESAAPTTAGSGSVPPPAPKRRPELRTTPAAGASLEEAARLAGSFPVGSHHPLLAALSDPASAAAKTLAGLGVELDQALEALRRAEVVGTTDEQPEERGRRHMIIRVEEGRLVVEVTDPEITDLGRGAVSALGGRLTEPGVIPGDLPASASLATVWQTLRTSLEDIWRRAAAVDPAQRPPASPPEQQSPPEAPGAAESA